jgi:hypothetical protein
MRCFVLLAHSSKTASLLRKMLGVIYIYIYIFGQAMSPGQAGGDAVFGLLGIVEIERP